MSLETDLAFAFDLADQAASISVPRFRRRDFTTSTKPDGSPVTDVDLAVEDALRATLARGRPDHAVVGEERGESGTSSWRWYLDPIDGTTLFLADDPQWMTLIALEHEGQVVLGIVDLPALGDRWWATRGGGAYHDGQPINVSTQNRLEHAVVSDTWSEDLASGNSDHPIYAVASRCGGIRPHQGHSFLDVASGQADIAVNVGSSPWDYAPLKVIVEEAGGRFSDFSGTDRIDTCHAVGTNRLLHAAVLDLI